MFGINVCRFCLDLSAVILMGTSLILLPTVLINWHFYGAFPVTLVKSPIHPHNHTWIAEADGQGAGLLISSILRVQCLVWGIEDTSMCSSGGWGTEPTTFRLLDELPCLLNHNLTWHCSLVSGPPASPPWCALQVHQRKEWDLNPKHRFFFLLNQETKS